MMKAGTETGSLVNHLYSRAAAPTPEVGMAATILSWTDRHAGTVIEVKPKKILVRLDHAKRVDRNGLSESQEYEYSRNPNGALYELRLQKDGSWRGRGRGVGVLLGQRREYRDPSF